MPRGGCSRSLQNFYSCRWRTLHPTLRVPVLYKISTLVDTKRKASFPFRSRSLQNFYSCRSFQKKEPITVPVLYKISTLVDFTFFFVRKKVPVLYKISTLVDRRGAKPPRIVPVLYKISTLVDVKTMRRELGGSPFFTKFTLLDVDGCAGARAGCCPSLQ